MTTDLERNIADCDTKIDSLEARISKDKSKNGESVKDLKARVKGYTEARAKLLDELPGGVDEPDDEG